MSTQAVDNTLGALFLGVAVSCMWVILNPEATMVLTRARRLFGVSALQVYYYYHYYPNDSLLHKVSVRHVPLFSYPVLNQPPPGWLPLVRAGQSEYWFSSEQHTAFWIQRTCVYP
jgi:hypothetical protein